MSVERSGGRALGRVGITRELIIACLVVCGVAGRAAAVVPECIGDCDTSRRVTVDELVRGVSIALGSLPPSNCAIFDRNADDDVTIDEVIAGVNAALQGCYPATFRGLCRVPGASGLIPCAAGSAVRLSRCLDRKPLSLRRRRAPAARLRRLGGRWAILAVARRSRSPRRPPSARDRRRRRRHLPHLTFGPATGGVIIDNLGTDPLSEAIAAS
jgi:hypothetical protein